MTIHDFNFKTKLKNTRTGEERGGTRRITVKDDGKEATVITDELIPNKKPDEWVEVKKS